MVPLRMRRVPVPSLSPATHSPSYQPPCHSPRAMAISTTFMQLCRRIDRYG